MPKQKLEMVKFVCSACGKRSNSIVCEGRMNCSRCSYKYERRSGEWMPVDYWKVKDKDNA